MRIGDCRLAINEHRFLICISEELLPGCPYVTVCMSAKLQRRPPGLKGAEVRCLAGKIIIEVGDGYPRIYHGIADRYNRISQYFFRVTDFDRYLTPLDGLDGRGRIEFQVIGFDKPGNFSNTMWFFCVTAINPGEEIVIIISHRIYWAG